MFEIYKYINEFYLIKATNFYNIGIVYKPRKWSVKVLVFYNTKYQYEVCVLVIFILVEIPKQFFYWFVI